ncbi:MAG: hypothetical protein ACI905_000623, partial [Roseivirga sp.]
MKSVFHTLDMHQLVWGSEGPLSRNMTLSII